MRKVMTFLMFVIGIPYCIAQVSTNIHEQLQFKYLTIDDGLNNNRVRALAQDEYGFIWIGTRTGISQFDGQQLKEYSHYYISDTTMVLFSELRSALNDSHGNIWFGGSMGVVKYNQNLDRFEEVILKDKSEPSACLDINEDPDSTIWFAQANSIVNYDPASEKIMEYKNDPSDGSSFPVTSAEKIIVDRQGNIWIGTSREGVVLFNKTTKNFIQYQANGNPGDLAENFVERIYEDPDGNIWITHNNQGISKYISTMQTFQHYFPEPEVKESGRVRGIIKDNLGNFWIGTQAGLYLFDEINEQFTKYASIDHPTSRLSHNSIQVIMIDNQDGLWLGTFAGGVSYTNLHTSGFINYSYSPIPNEYFLNDKNIYSIALDQKGNVWAGTENGGLNYLDRTTSKFSYYLFDAGNPNSLRSNNIKSILVEPDNNIWIGTYRGGMSYLDVENGRFTNYMPNPENPNSIHSDIAYLIKQDPKDQNMLWVSTNDGVSIFNKRDKTFRRFTSGVMDSLQVPEALTNSRAFDIVELDNKSIAFAINELYILDYLKNDITVIVEADGVEFGEIPFLLVDKLGALWFYSNDHLFRRDKINGKIKVYSMKDNLPQIGFLCALEDEKGNIWMSSNKGLFKFENLVNNKDTLIVKRFDKTDNLQSMEFLYGSVAKSNRNEMFFGGINGFNSFYNRSVSSNTFKPFVHITGLIIENHKVEIEVEIDGRVVLEKSILDTDYLDIFHQTKSFTFVFNSFHYNASESNQLAYILEGYDENWNYLIGSRGTATYTNLPPGDYTFKVIGANNNGLWNEEPDFIHIHISPPFYKTIWFYLLVILVLSGGVYFFIRSREKKLKSDKEILQQAIDDKTSELEKVKQEIIAKNEEDKIKNWLNSKVKEFNKILNVNKDTVDSVGGAVLNFLVKTLEVQQGGILLLNDDKEGDNFLEIVSSFAYENVDKKSKRIEIDEGLAGACFSKGEKIIIDNLPDDYSKISSGLGEARPNYLALIPISIEDKILGVLEISSFNNLEEHHMELVENIIESMASTLFVIRSNEMTHILLEQTKIQTEEMKAQEEEMRQNMEELEATSENFKRRELELENQILELKEKKGKT